MIMASDKRIDVAENEKAKGGAAVVTATVPMPHLPTGRGAEVRAMRITALLQTTLDLNRQIELFASEVHDAVPYDSVTYSHDSLGISVTEGGIGRHSCAYRLTVEGEDLGEICFTRNTRFQEKETQTIELLLCSLVYPLRNALEYRRALDEARRDPLTGTANRHSLEVTMQREAALAHRHCSPLSVIFLDIDRFKSINDTHGHAAGDHAIRALVGCIQSAVRNTDVVARYGGDEFVVMLSNTPCEGALHLAERIREAVEAFDGSTIAKGVKLTASLGVATLSVGEAAGQLLARADQLLKLAKHAGRNRVVS
jgi:diguanylate cyclase (GGDEF)-like protein